MIDSKPLNQYRQYNKTVSDPTKSLLDRIASNETDSDSYKDALIAIGRELSLSVFQKVNQVSNENITLAVTAEDADFLAKGFIEQYEKTSGKKVYLTCFWNDHKTDELSNKTVAPVIHEYLEPGFNDNHTLVVIKSILSSGCVVRSNILSLYERMSPRSIFVAAPVIYTDAEEKLSQEFPSEYSSKFDFTWFAMDSKREEDGTVVPGIGGQIYDRLELGGKPVDIRWMPKVVRSRIMHII